MKIIALSELENGLVVRPVNDPSARWFKIIALHSAPSSPSRQAHVSFLDGGGGAMVRLENVPYEQANTLLAARKHADDVAGENRSTTPSGREVLRGHTIKINLVAQVDGQGNDCGYCSHAYRKPNPITHQVYGTTIDGEPNNWSCCRPCVLHTIDDLEDVDHDKPIIVEEAQ